MSLITIHIKTKHENNLNVKTCSNHKRIVYVQLAACIFKSNQTLFSNLYKYKHVIHDEIYILEKTLVTQTCP